MKNRHFACFLAFVTIMALSMHLGAQLNCSGGQCPPFSYNGTTLTVTKPIATATTIAGTSTTAGAYSFGPTPVAVGTLSIDPPAINGIGLLVNDSTSVGFGIYTSQGTTLNWNYNHNANDTGYLNYNGYLDGTTRFRDLIIADGKETPIATFKAASGGTVVLQTATTSGSGISLATQGKVYTGGITAESGTNAALCQNTATAEVQVNTGVSTCLVSSLRYKDWIADLTCKDAERIVGAMQPGQFRDKGAKDIRFGFAAESVHQVEPKLTYYEADGKTPRSVDYERYVSVLTKAEQCRGARQQAEIDELKRELRKKR